MQRWKFRRLNVSSATVVGVIVSSITRKITKGRSHFLHWKSFDELCAAVKLSDCSPASLRRNIITREAELNALIGREFEIQGVRFDGVPECRPCYWMDRAIAPGTEKFLKGRGDLSARILTDGMLRSSAPIRVGTVE